MTTADVISTTSTVRQRYEAFPYPARVVEEEKTRFLFTPLDDLAAINFYCYQGRRDFSNGFRAMVAGGGTGDAAIHLAEQLKGTDAVIVHLDLSQASIEIAQQRAAVRGLENITWMQGSLLDLPNCKVEPFDYINCTGVLHHLSDPQTGLHALKSMLNPGGAMGLMLYAKYGRTGIYHMQELMRLVNRNLEDPKQQIANTRTVIETLPETNWYKQSKKIIDSTEQLSDVEMYDLLLHSHDRPFSILEVYELLENEGLNLVEFLPGARAMYDPHMAFTDPQMLEQVLALPLPQQQAAAELFWGAIGKHDFWVSLDATSSADFNDTDYIPFFSQIAEIREIRDSLQNHSEGEWSMGIEHPGGVTLRMALELGDVARKFISLVDGLRTIGEIEQTILDEQSPRLSIEEIHTTCHTLFDTLRSNDLMLLRHKTVPATRAA